MQRNSISLNSKSLTPVENDDSNFDKAYSKCEVINDKQDISAKESGTLNDNDLTDYTKSQFYTALSPLFTSAKICGLYYKRPVGKNFSPHLVYCWLISALPWIILSVIIYVLHLMSTVNVRFLNLVMYIGFSLLCAVNAASSLKNSHNPKHMQEFFVGLENLRRYGGPFIQPSQVRAFTKIVVIATWTVYVCNSILIGYMSFSSAMLDDILEKFGFSPTDPLPKSVLVAGVFALELQWLFPNSIEICLSIMLFREYRLFYDYLEKKVPKFSHFQGSIEFERKRYIDMVQIVEAADSILTFHNGASFVCNIINLCVILYMLAYFNNSLQVGPFVIWFVLFATDIIVVCICGIIVNTAVSINSCRICD